MHPCVVSPCVLSPGPPNSTAQTSIPCSNANGNGSAGSNGASLYWLSPDEKTREPFTTDPEAAWQLAQDYDLCITGELRCIPLLFRTSP